MRGKAPAGRAKLSLFCPERRAVSGSGETRGEKCQGGGFRRAFYRDPPRLRSHLLFSIVLGQRSRVVRHISHTLLSVFFFFFFKVIFSPP